MELGTFLSPAQTCAYSTWGVVNPNGLTLRTCKAGVLNQSQLSRTCSAYRISLFTISTMQRASPLAACPRHSAASNDALPGCSFMQSRPAATGPEPTLTPVRQSGKRLSRAATGMAPACAHQVRLHASSTRVCGSSTSVIAIGMPVPACVEQVRWTQQSLWSCTILWM